MNINVLVFSPDHLLQTPRQSYGCHKEASGPGPSQRGQSPITQNKRCKGHRPALQQIPGQPEESTCLSFGQQHRLVGFVSKERRVVELEEHEAGDDQQ